MFASASSGQVACRIQFLLALGNNFDRLSPARRSWRASSAGIALKSLASPFLGTIYFSEATGPPVQAHLPSYAEPLDFKSLLLISIGPVLKGLLPFQLSPEEYF